MSRLLTRRKALLFSSLLLATMVLLSGCPDDGGSGPPADPIDSDADLLIDVSSIERLYNIRFNLVGTDYRDSPLVDSGVQCGAAADTECRGYELTRSLDFADPDSYESGAVNIVLRPDNSDPDNATNSGWVPIGTGSSTGTGTQFATLFEGNGNTITNLYARGIGTIGLFGATEDAVISNLGLINTRLYGNDGVNTIGEIAGFVTRTTIVASYVSGGTIYSGNGPNSVGGIVGQTTSGNIVASYASVTLNGGTGSGSIGGLLGSQGGDIYASYATGNVNGDVGNNENIGGLVGIYSNGLIVSSYSTANSASGTSTSDNVGALIGNGLDLGGSPANNTTASYGFGMVTGNDGSNAFTPDPPANVTSATGLTLANAGSTWDDAASLSLGAWDFGNASQPPALRYADYDGMVRTGDMGETLGGMFACANAANPPADAILIVKCGELIPRQR